MGARRLPAGLAVLLLLLLSTPSRTGAYFPVARNVGQGAAVPGATPLPPLTVGGAVLPPDQRVIILKWPTPTVNVTIAGSHDPVFSGPTTNDQRRTGVVDDTHPLIVDGSDPIKAIRDAISAWSSINGSALRYLERATPGVIEANPADRINLITFADTATNRAHFSTQGRPAVAITITSYNQQGDLLDFDVVFNAMERPIPAVAPTPNPSPTPLPRDAQIFFKYTTTGFRDTFDDPNDYLRARGGNLELIHLNTIFFQLIAELAGIDRSAVVSSMTFIRTDQRDPIPSPAPDDVAAAIATYPAGTFTRTATDAAGSPGPDKAGVGFVPEVPPAVGGGGGGGPGTATVGGIAGRVTFNQDGVFGAHVVAEEVGGLGVIGNLTLQAGTYSILGLRPGQYRLYAEPLDGPRGHNTRLEPFPQLLGGFDERVNVGFRTTFLGGNSAPQIVTVTAGRITGVPDIQVDRIGRIVNPEFIGIIPSGAVSPFTAQPPFDLKLAMSPGDSLIVGISGFGVGSATGVFVNGPGVTIDTSQSQPLPRPTGFGFFNFRVTVAPNAPLGDRSLFVQSGPEVTALSGALTIAPRAALRTELSVNGHAFRSGDLMVLRAHLDNLNGREQPADAYLSLDCPNGGGRQYWTGRGLDPRAVPFAQGVTVPARAYETAMELLRGVIPPGLASGTCRWYLELRAPGTGALIGEAAVAEFQFSP